MINEIFEKKSHTTTIDIVQTQIDGINRKNIIKTGMRVYDGKSIGVAGALGNFNHDELEKKAIEALGLKIAYPCDVSSNHTEKSEIKLSGISEDKLVEETEFLLEHLRREFPDFIFSHKVTYSDEETSLCNDQKLDLSHRSSLLNIVLLFKEKTSSNIFDGYWEEEIRDYDRGKVLKGIEEICNGYRNKVDLPLEETIPVIFSTASDLAFKKIIEGLSGQKIGMKSSIFSDKMQKKVFNDNFSLVQSLHPDDYSGPFFDDEGCVNKDYKIDLIRNGTIVSPYTDKKNAQQYGFSHTGSAVSAYDGVPSPGLKNILILESENTLIELLKGRKAVYAYMPSGGDFTSTGDFASPVQLSFLFDGEKIFGRLPQLNISSNLFDMFGKSFIGVSKNRITSFSNRHYMVMEMKVAKG
ncbi:MAG: peptidase U62 [Candidatus Riflebacteria bacterium]|nr:peptidase U62 [Candidatus Riflebacteria bacterium]